MIISLYVNKVRYRSKTLQHLYKQEKIIILMNKNINNIKLYFITLFVLMYHIKIKILKIVINNNGSEIFASLKWSSFVFNIATYTFWTAFLKSLLIFN